MNISSKSIPEGTISSPTDGTVIPILGYASELLPAGQISRHEKIVNVPFQLPINSKSSIIEEWSSKHLRNISFLLSQYSYLSIYLISLAALQYSFSILF